MVYYFSSSTVSPPGLIYAGKDKFESEPPPPSHTHTQTRTEKKKLDEDLIKYGWDEDVWV